MAEKEFDKEAFEEMMKRSKEDKVERYRRLNRMVRPGQILFVGSSLMEQFPVGELLQDLGKNITVYNRGVGGFTTAELREVLDVCVYQVQPRHIFINIGTNDLNGPDYSLEELLARYEDILREIRAHLPEAGLTLLAYYPMCEPVALENEHMADILQYRNNVRIAEANRAVEQLAARLGAGFLDLNYAITDETGSVRREYSIEGMHMYATGYMEVLKALLPTLEKV